MLVKDISRRGIIEQVPSQDYVAILQGRTRRDPSANKLKRTLWPFLAKDITSDVADFAHIDLIVAFCQ